MKLLHIILALFLFIGISCTPENQTEAEQKPINETLPPKSEFPDIVITTDKAMYNPGDEVIVRASGGSTAGLGVRYWHLGDVIEEAMIDGAKEWTWNPPAEDFKGYFVELVGKDESGKIVTLSTTGVDVSSCWTRFPRYGYLGRFDNCPALKREKVLNNLNRHHINALQYYEWAYDHHHPLCGTPENPEPVWEKYLSNGGKNLCELEVIQGYIEQGHEYNMVSMFYNLCNGLFEWAEEDGCGSDWYIYSDPNRQNKVFHPLAVPPFRSNLYQCDPGDDEWIEWITKQHDDVYKVFDFDGFHIDQLGNIGKVYNHAGEPVDLPAGYEKFIKAAKKAQPDKYLVFNAVSGYGQDHIAAAPVDILYNEVWDESFNALKQTLDENRRIDPNRNTVIPAYIHGTNSGYFNTPAVLMLDAVIFAMGGSHLELGEHLISDIYWPACQLNIHPELEEALIEYYDFLVGYENILRDNVKESKINVTSDEADICYWLPSKGKVNVYATHKSGRQMIHLLNFKDAVHTLWTDKARTQAEPKLMKEFEIVIPCLSKIERVWTASPDFNGGAPMELEFVNQGTSVKVKVPSLKYWTMIVME